MACWMTFFADHQSCIAATLGLLEQNFTSNPLTVTIQAANRFLLRTFAENYRLGRNARHMEQALTTGAITAIRCQHCANEMLKPGETLVHDLIYPPKVSVNRMSFAHMIY